MMHYPTLLQCKNLLFPLIEEEMATNEPAPDYKNEKRGLQRTESILMLMQRDDYADFFAKAAYMFCALIDGHPFSNGNKRLAVALLSFFFILNNYVIHTLKMEDVRQELERLFPDLKWQTVHSFHYPHEYFLYHLALVIADRNQKGKMTFTQEQSAVVDLLKFIVMPQ